MPTATAFAPPSQLAIVRFPDRSPTRVAAVRSKSPFAPRGDQLPVDARRTVRSGVEVEALMVRYLIAGAVALAGAVSTAVPASANPPSVIVIPPTYPPAGYGAQSPGMPYSTPTFTIYPPGSVNLPAQFNNRSDTTFPPGAQNCSAPPYACPASAPNTPGNACTCPTNEGGIINGIVR
jgi:hypothetical protein